MSTNVSSMITVTNPYDGSFIAEIPQHSIENVEQSLVNAHAVFQNKKQWLPAYQRIAILERTAKIMSEQVHELTLLASSEGGKPYNDSKVEVLRAIQGVKLAIEHIPQIKGEQIPMGLTESSANRLAFTQREPIGVVTSISAFNHPLNLIIHQTVPAIAVGCPVIIKPSNRTPLSCLRFVEILKEAGLPDAWCQVMVCKNEDAEKLVTDTRIGFFSFIGSARVGWMLRSKLAPGIRCALEHGGVAPAIVDHSADINTTVESLLKGAFYHAGQVCVSVQRIYVHESICESFAHLLAIGASELKVGNPASNDTEVGPLITPSEVDRIEQWVDEAVNKGAILLAGGKRLGDTCYAPTVLLNPPTDCNVSQLEVFGPVVCVYAYKSSDDAISQANSLSVAFQAAVYTKELDTALSMANQLNATAVMVNDHTAFRVDWMPFGGRNTSGIGMGGIQYSMHEMTQDKMIVIKSNVLL